jgi:hypothetical protein
VADDDAKEADSQKYLHAGLLAVTISNKIIREFYA